MTVEINGVQNKRYDKVQQRQMLTLRNVSESTLLEIKSVVVHFQGKSFGPGRLLGYQRAGVGGGPPGKGT
jgi:hypothetical protein